MSYIKFTIYLLVVLTACPAFPAVVRNVPGGYETIQAAIDACEDFDTVVVAEGTYSGSGNRNISLRGKAITVRSSNPDDPDVVNNTVIDGDDRYRGFIFNMREKADSKEVPFCQTRG